MEYGKGGYAIVDGSFLTADDITDLMSYTPVAITPEQYNSLYTSISSSKPLLAKLTFAGGEAYYPCCGAFVYEDVGVRKWAKTAISLRDFDNHYDISFEFIAMHVYATDEYSIQFGDIIVTTPTP